MNKHKSTAFTLCSNNYLGNALSFAQSFKKHNPHDRVCIIIVDKKNVQINYDFYTTGIEIIFVEELNIPQLYEMALRYNIIELNTAIKPFAFTFLINKFADSEFFYYFDPDILIFDEIKSISNELSNFNAIITPHILTPIALDNGLPNENLFLSHGIYNLGFIGLRNTEESKKIALWWSERLVQNGFNDIPNGMFTDQLYINYLPIFFKNVKISFNLGLNVAVWNLHERTISTNNGKYYINNNTPLIFFHYSGYNYKNPHQATKVKIRNTFENTPKLKELYSTYHNTITNNNIEYFKNIPCYFINYKEDWKKKNKYKDCSIIKCIFIYLRESAIYKHISNIINNLRQWMR